MRPQRRTVHDKAMAGFGRSPGSYERARPGYPEAAVRRLVEVLDLGPSARVVELGAGTGLFTHALARHGLHVIAVEPVPAMRAALAHVAPGRRASIAVVDGTAEDTGLPGSIADAVVAATAWHWFDAPRALLEARRLLRSGGLGLLWNDYDETLPWVREYAAVATRRRAADHPDARSGKWRASFDGLSDWSRLREEQFANPVPTSAALLVERILSSSAIASLPEAQQREAAREVVDLLERHRPPTDDGGAKRDIQDRTSKETDGEREETSSPRVLPYVTRVCWTNPIR